MVLDSASEELWMPGDLDPIAPPDGMPVQGGPAGLALLEQAVGNGIVVGEVSDATTLNPIPGALVEIAGTGRTAEADAQGRFQFVGLPAGTFNIEASQLGYFTDTTVVTVIEGSPSEVRFGLRSRPTDDSASEFTLEEESVIGEYQGDSQGDFNLELAMDAPSLSSGLTSEDFAKENVSDAGEAVGKISGANIVGGKFAVVRGLADRYIGTTFNGAQISSAVSDRKAIELDLFPTSALKGINVAKTYRPDLLGDFGGASIDIQSRNFPNEPYAFVKVKGEYVSGMPGEFLEVPGGSLGFSGSTWNPLNPSRFTRTNPVTGRVSLVTSPPAEASEVWKNLNATSSAYPAVGSPVENYSYGIGFGQTFEVTDYLDLGLVFGHSWKTGSDYNISENLNQPERSWTQEDFTQSVEWDAYLAGSARLNEDHEISAIYFRKHIGANNVSSGTDVRDPNGRFEFGNDSIGNLSGTRPYYGADAEQLGNFFEIDPLERDLEIIQLSGNSRIGGERGIKVKWGLTNSDAMEERPNTTFQEFTTLDFDSPALDNAQAAGEAGITQTAERVFRLPPGSLTYEEARQEFIDAGPAGVRTLERLESQLLPVRDPSLGQIDTLAVSRFTGEVGAGNLLTRANQSVRESTKDSSLAFDIPWYFSEDNEERGFMLGLGTGRISRERITRGSRFELISENLNASGNSNGGFNEDDFYPSTDANGNGLSNLGESLVGNDNIADFFTGSSKNGPYYIDSSIGSNNFAGLVASNADANHDFDSLFISGDLFLGDTFIRGGVRYESEVRTARFVEPKPIGEQDPEPLEETVWLPSVSLGTSIMDGKLNLLTAWSRTVARPTFFEWVPVRSLDLSSGLIRSGNPNLINSTITNMDIAGEYSANEDSTFRLSVFQKTIIDPIVNVRSPGVADSLGFINGEDGFISGIEMEAEFSNLGPFSLKGNVTYIEATLNYEFNTGQQVEVNFPFQPNWIANLNLGYENEEWDFGANLIYNFTGEYATLLRTTPTSPDVLREPRHTLDLVLRKGFNVEGGGRLAVSIGIENLIGTEETFRYSEGPATIDGRIESQIQTDRVYFAELNYEF